MSMSDTPFRERVFGLTSKRFDHVGTPDLVRSWLPYWEAVRDGVRAPNPGDTVEEAQEQAKRIRAEIDARMAEGYAGPNRHRAWRV